MLFNMVSFQNSPANMNQIKCWKFSADLNIFIWMYIGDLFLDSEIRA